MWQTLYPLQRLQVWVVILWLMFQFQFKSVYPPASKESSEVANLTERKNPHTPIYFTEYLFNIL